jgi:hypothetical protein
MLRWVYIYRAELTRGYPARAGKSPSPVIFEKYLFSRLVDDGFRGKPEMGDFTSTVICSFLEQFRNNNFKVTSPDILSSNREI